MSASDSVPAAPSALSAPLTRWLSLLLECGPSDFEQKTKAELVALLAAPVASVDQQQELIGQVKGSDSKNPRDKDANKSKDKAKPSRPSTGKAKATTSSDAADAADTVAASAVSCRVVTRQDIEKVARATTLSHGSTFTGTTFDAGPTGPTGPTGTTGTVPAINFTPKQLALAYQTLILRDQEEEFVIKQQQQQQVQPGASSSSAPAIDGASPSDQKLPITVISEISSSSSLSLLSHGSKYDGSESNSMRVYVLVDYPSNVAEANALVQPAFGSSSLSTATGSSCRSLLDGVVLLLDLVRELRGRRKSASGSMALELEEQRRKSRTTGSSISCRLNEGESLVDVATSLPTAFETANPLVKQLFEEATKGNLCWKDVLFTELEANSNATSNANLNISVSSSDLTTSINSTNSSKLILDSLYDQLLVTAQTMTCDKYAFLEWSSSVQVVPIPDCNTGLNDPMLWVYHEILNNVHPRSINAAVVLFAMQEAIALTQEPLKDAPSEPEPQAATTDDLMNRTNNDDHWISDMLFETIEYGDLASCRLAMSIDQYDSKDAAFGMSRGSQPTRLDLVEKRMWQASDLPGVGNKGRKAMPRVAPLSAVERSIHATEFGQFCELPLAKVTLTSQLMQLETLLGAAGGGGGGGTWRNKLRIREWSEHLPKEILPQRLGHVLLSTGFPNVLKQYDQQHDQLLLAVLNPTASGRFRTTSWSPHDAVRHVVSFKDWRREAKIPDEYITPRSQAALHACVPVTALQLDHLAEKVFVLFPADCSVIRVTQKKHDEQLNWLSIYAQDGTVLGLRSAAYGASTGSSGGAGAGVAGGASAAVQTSHEHPEDADDTEMGFQSGFFAAFEDDSSLFVTEGKEMLRKPDGYGGMKVVATFPSGLVVQAGSDGTISQLFVTQGGPVQPQDAAAEGEKEIERVIDPEGNVLCKKANGGWFLMTPHGDVHKSRGAGQEEEEEEEEEDTLMVVDPHTNALIERRPSGVVVVSYPNGSRSTFHSDGTVMCQTGDHLLICKPNFASVLLDLEVNETACRHAAGQKVAMTKGGRRVRSSIQIGGEDDTLIQLLYDTSVIAHVNGTIRVVKRALGSKIIVKDNGHVDYFPPTKPTEMSADCDLSNLTISMPNAPASQEPTGTHHQQKPPEEDEEDPDRNGVFYFDCEQGNFQLCDQEQNRFCVQMGDFHGAPQISVELAGTVGAQEAKAYGLEPIAIKAVINEPMEPFLFVLNGDGTGQEVLRPKEALDFLQTHRSVCDRRHALEQVLDSTQQEQHRERDDENSGSEVFEVFNFVVPLLRSQDSVGITRLFDHLTPSSASALLHDMQQLLKPGITARQWLPQSQTHPRVASQRRDFIKIRRLLKCRAMTNIEVDTMNKSLRALQDWRHAREQNKDEFKVDDPRDAETLAQEAALSKKVIAAHKAARAKKKMARLQKEQQQQQQQQQQQSQRHSQTDQLPVLDEAEEEPQHDSDEDDLHFHGVDGDSDSESDINTGDQADDFDTLLWTAFANEDVENLGKLSLMQTRRALVHALGFGASQQEIKAALEHCNTQETSQVTFDAFAEVAAWLQQNQMTTEEQERQDLKGRPSQNQQFHEPSLSSLPAGSATALVRLYKS